jgi:hypothetical protein
LQIGHVLPKIPGWGNGNYNWSHVSL